MAVKTLECVLRKMDKQNAGVNSTFTSKLCKKKLLTSVAFFKSLLTRMSLTWIFQEEKVRKNYLQSLFDGEFCESFNFHWCENDYCFSNGTQKCSFHAMNSSFVCDCERRYSGDLCQDLNPMSIEDYKYLAIDRKVKKLTKFVEI